MRISVDAHALGLRLTGNEVYVRNLLERFDLLDKESEFFAYYAAASGRAMIPPRMHQARVSRNPFKRLGLDIPRLVDQHRPDLLHVQYTSPLRCSVPVVVSVHDVSFLSHPQYFTPWRALQLRITVRRTVRLAHRVIAPSEFSRRELLRAYQLPESKVHVISNAVSQRFRPLPRENAAAQVRARFGIAEPFIFTVGDLQPRKNHIGLIRAFAEAVKQRPRMPHRLVIAGKDTTYAHVIRRAAAHSGVASRIRFTGFVSDEELLQLYGACDFFAFPSFYEGFGIPIVEAMACGRAVACSNTTAMPEVASPAAILFNPASLSDMTRALLNLVDDAELRHRMERLGLQRASAFSWTKSAERTLDIYRDVAGEVVRSKTHAFSRASS